MLPSSKMFICIYILIPFRYEPLCRLPTNFVMLISHEKETNSQSSKQITQRYGKCAHPADLENQCEVNQLVLLHKLINMRRTIELSSVINMIIPRIFINVSPETLIISRIGERQKVITINFTANKRS